LYEAEGSTNETKAKAFDYPKDVYEMASGRTIFIKEVSVTTTKRAAACLVCLGVAAGCGLLKKESVESTAAPKAGAVDGTVETAGKVGPADAAVEPSVKAGTEPEGKKAAGSAAFTVKRSGDVPAGYGIRPGDYTMDLRSASMVTGTENGLKLAFESVENWMSVFLPSIKKFGIQHIVDDKGSRFKLKHSPLPFVIGSDDYPSDPKDGRGRDLMIGPVVTNIVKLASGDSTARLGHFKKFKFTISSLSVDGHALTMSCSFEGESAPDPSQPAAVYTLSGSLAVKDAELGLTHKD
jgi:hypothetical protein